MSAEQNEFILFLCGIGPTSTINEKDIKKIRLQPMITALNLSEY